MTKIDDISKENRRAKARKRHRRNTILFSVVMLTCVLALMLDVFLAYMYHEQKTANEELLLEKQNLQSENEDMQIILEEIENSEKEAENDEYVKKDELDEFKQGVIAEQKQKVLDMFEDGETILTILETVYNEKIVVPDSGNYYFFDILDNIAKHGLDFDKIIYPELNEETGEYSGDIAYEDDSVSIKKGIDVSKFQGDIDFNAVKNDGYEFVYIRAGYRGYETGKIVEDEKFRDNVQGANDAGMDTGVYFFTEANTTEEGVEEAEFLLDLINETECRIDLPIVIDVEQSSNVAKSRTRNVTSEQRTNIVIAFCERIKEAGYTPMIYGNLKSHMRMMDIDKLEEYDKWFAYYRFPLRYPYKFKVWQYSSTGKVAGIKGDADLDIAIY